VKKRPLEDRSSGRRDRYAGSRLNRASPRFEAFPAQAKFEFSTVTRIEPGVQSRGLTVLELIKVQFSVVGRSNPVRWNSENRSDDVILLGIEDLNGVTLRGRIERFDHIRAGREKRTLDLNRLTYGDVGFLIPFIGLHRGYEYSADHNQRQGGEPWKIVFQSLAPLMRVLSYFFCSK
jgi:hypothetical protein